MSKLFQSMIETGFYDVCVKDRKPGDSRMLEPKYSAPVFVKILDRANCVPENVQLPGDAIFVSLGYCIDGNVDESKFDVIAICPYSHDVFMVSSYGGAVKFYSDDGSPRSSNLIAFCIGHLHEMIVELDANNLMLSMKYGQMVNNLEFA